MTSSELNAADSAICDEIVSAYDAGQRGILTDLAQQLEGNIQRHAGLAHEIHFIRSRIKDPDHLRNKIERKILRARKDGVKFQVTKENLFQEINDLVGIRILHTHTRQMDRIHKYLHEVFDEHRYELVEAPFARVWDSESTEYFKSLGLATEDSFPDLYSSVHYVVQPNRRTLYTAEIQVRTLAEEVWGEVDHSINYPTKTSSVACSEQLKVLARVASSCSRLVDSIFRSLEDHKSSSEHPD